MRELSRLTFLIFKMELRNKSFIIPSFLFPLLMLTLMSVAGSEGGAQAGISYASFLTPGILCMGYAAVALVALPVMVTSYREKGLLRNVKISKLPMSVVAFSILIAQLIFMLLQTIVLFVFACLVLQARFTLTASSWMLIPVVILGLFSLLSLGFLMASRLSSSRSATMVGNLTNLVAIFLGGVFFPADIWPRFMQPLTWINPLTWIIECARKSLLYNTIDIHSLTIELLAVCAIGIVSFVLALKLFKYE